MPKLTVLENAKSNLLTQTANSWFMMLLPEEWFDQQATIEEDAAQVVLPSNDIVSEWDGSFPPF